MEIATGPTNIRASRTGELDSPVRRTGTVPLITVHSDRQRVRIHRSCPKDPISCHGPRSLACWTSPQLLRLFGDVGRLQFCCSVTAGGADKSFAAVTDDENCVGSPGWRHSHACWGVSIHFVETILLTPVSHADKLSDDTMARWKFRRIVDGHKAWRVLRRLLLGVDGTFVRGGRHEHRLDHSHRALCIG